MVCKAIITHIWTVKPSSHIWLSRLTSDLISGLIFIGLDDQQGLKVDVVYNSLSRCSTYNNLEDITLFFLWFVLMLLYFLETMEQSEIKYGTIIPLKLKFQLALSLKKKDLSKVNADR